MPGVPLRARTTEHVSAFLNGLGQLACVEPWQVHRAQEALRLLYQAFLPGIPPGVLGPALALPRPLHFSTLRAFLGASKRLFGGTPTHFKARLRDRFAVFIVT
jgi:hypothetical protein